MFNTLCHIPYDMFHAIIAIHLKITTTRHTSDPRQVNIVLNPIHIIAPHFSWGGERAIIAMKMGLKTALKKYDLKSTLLTFLHMYKQNCITKEKYTEEYKINDEIGEREELSLGEDLETFLTNIKQGRLTNETIAYEEDFTKYTFLIRLLNANDRRRLDQKDKEFMETFFRNSYGEADVPREEWESSESNLKFSQSWCHRETHFIEASENSSNP